MKNKIAIIESGFMSNYLSYFIELCEQNNVEIHLFTFFEHSKYEKSVRKIFKLNSKYIPKKLETKRIIEEEIMNIVDVNDYDYFLTDCLGLSFACNVFHIVSLAQRLSLAKNIFYRKILQFFHKKRTDHEKNYYQNSPKIFVVSNYLKDDYSKNCLIPKDRIFVVYPGTNTQLSDFSRIKQNDKFVIGAVACGFVTKGGYNVLGALNILKKKYSNKELKVKIINPKYQKQWILKLYVKLLGLEPYVEFLPYQKDISEFYKSADCIVCASNYEAFGRVVTEAMLCRTPVIVGSNVGASEIIKDGQNGFIFNYKNSTSDLAQKIEFVMSQKDKLNDVIEEAYLTAKKLTWQNFAENIFNKLYL